MNTMEFQLQGISDPRISMHATSALPAWLWSADGGCVLWANPAGAHFFERANAAELAKRTFGPADPHRRQVAQLAGNLPANGAIRLQRLRGFGARPGMLVTCACARLDFLDGSHAVLIAPLETSQRSLPLLERLHRLVQGTDLPIAVLSPEGVLIAASDAARALPVLGTLSEADLDDVRNTALRTGRAEATLGLGRLVLQRIGAGADIALAVLITPVGAGADAPIAAGAELDAVTPPRHEEPALSGEATASHIDARLPSAAGITPPPPPAPPAAAPWEKFPAAKPRRHPLRFVWQMDRDTRFTATSEEFLALAGPPTAARLGRTWAEIANELGLDPKGRVMKAFATHDTWSGIVLGWPVEDGGSLAVELAGLPVYDRERNFTGFRGFGVCRDLDALARLAAFRDHDAMTRQALSADATPIDAEPSPASTHTEECGGVAQAPNRCAARSANEHPSPTDLDCPVETPPSGTSPNVVPFRPLGSEAKVPALTAVENSAFNELARQLSERLEREEGAAPPSGESAPVAAESTAPDMQRPAREAEAAAQTEWLIAEPPPARGEDQRDRTLLDLLPTGVLIYRLDRLLYANPAFLQRMGYSSLHALEQVGGLDALYVEPGVPSCSTRSEAGTPVTISQSQPAGDHATPTNARLFTISWDGASALALMFLPERSAPASAATAMAPPASAPAGPAGTVGHALAEDLATILDTTAEGVLMFDASGNIQACNRSAEALFGYDGNELGKRNLTELFAPESQPVVLDYLQSIAHAGAAVDAGRDVLGQVGKGGIIPLSMTIGRTRPEGANFFAVFRDHSQGKSSDNELREARRLAERAANAKADLLARISHEVRMPLNAIIGFAEVMIGERFGPLGNERYGEYLKDIRGCGERVVAIIDDLLELSRIETGKLDLAFASQNLNELVESCVSMMQPQANRERIIIRTSLAHLLPPVMADAPSLRQITMNLIGNSIYLANPGGQVIVSTALSDHGEVVLRVRDTGHGLSHDEVAAALEPFRTSPPSDEAKEKGGLNLSLTKALIEANRAQFQIKTGGRSGTLVEVVFARALAGA